MHACKHSRAQSWVEGLPPGKGPWPVTPTVDDETRMKQHATRALGEQKRVEAIKAM
jgi:hypothetical protein